MRKPKLVNLLDEALPEEVFRRLGVFETSPVRAVVEPEVVMVKHGAIFAQAHDADIIVLHFPAGGQQLLFASSLRWRNPGAKIVWVLHGQSAAWEAANVPHRGRFRAAMRLSLRVADRIVCVSHAQARWLAEATGIAPEAITVIHPCSDRTGVAVLPPPQRRPGAPLRIGALGPLSRDSGFDLLIRAYRNGLMPGTELVIGGTGGDIASLRAMASGARGIAFAGPVSDLAAFLAQCDAVAVPARWSAWSEIADAASLAGRPVLAAPVDGLADQASYIVDFTDDAAIAKACSALHAADPGEFGTADAGSASDFGPDRHRQWARLCDRLLTGGVRGEIAD